MNKDSIFRIDNNGDTGTAFLITNKFLLTCYHCIEGFKYEELIEVYDVDNKKFSAKLISDEYFDSVRDIAVIELINYGSINKESIKLSPLILSEKKLEWESFGFPDHEDLAKEGDPFSGNFGDKLRHSESYDFRANVTRSSVELPNYRGFSGSPMFYNGYCVAICCFQCTEKLLGAISIHSILEFLEKKIGLKEFSIPIKKSEAKYLDHLVDISKIGFGDNENLEYQETFGNWKLIKNEDEYFPVKPIRDLINEYFDKYDSDNYKGKAAFIISDFGKGKSSFMKNFACELAKKYLSDYSLDSYFPIYFNLKEFHTFYEHSLEYGALYKYLDNEFGIDLSHDYYKNRKIFFLFDSLDESGELTEKKIKNVLDNVLRIEKLKGFNRKNKVVFATRPIEAFIFQLIEKYHPLKFDTLTRNGSENVSAYISLNGFTSKQFDSYISNALKGYWKDINKNSLTSYSLKLYNELEETGKVELYYNLTHFEEGELQRPIFAYILYVLLSRNIDISKLGKVELFLEFLNQITKEAKHKNDNNFEVDLIDEVRFRNILHLTAALWQFNKNKPDQVTKDSIYTVLEPKSIIRDREKAQQEITIAEIEDIQFISHSYLGSKNDTIFFQHQSFAEVLLAEYYLKTFIKYLFDSNTAEFNQKIAIGNPTEQTVLFLKGLIFKLKTSLTDINSRRMLFPLFASMCVKGENTKNNEKLSHSFFVEELYKKWFSRIETKVSSSKDIYNEMLEEWVVDKEFFNELNRLLKSIIERDEFLYSSSKSIFEIHEFNNQKSMILSTEPYYNMVPDIDKWLALLIGNELESHKKFNSTLNGMKIIPMFRNWNQYDKKAYPSWTKEYFTNLKIRRESDEVIDLSYLNFDDIDFSDSYLEGINFERSSFIRANFSGTKFVGACFYGASLIRTNFANIEIIKIDSYRSNFFLQNAFILPGVIFPRELAEKMSNYKYLIMFLNRPSLEQNYNFSGDKSRMSKTMDAWEFDYLKRIFLHLMINNECRVIDITRSFTVKDNKGVFTKESKDELITMYRDYKKRKKV